MRSQGCCHRRADWAGTPKTYSRLGLGVKCRDFDTAGVLWSLSFPCARSGAGDLLGKSPMEVRVQVGVSAAVIDGVSPRVGLAQSDKIGAQRFEPLLDLRVPLSFIVDLTPILTPILAFSSTRQRSGKRRHRIK